jgi:hypothetical protein
MGVEICEAKGMVFNLNGAFIISEILRSAGFSNLPCAMTLQRKVKGDIIKTP